MAIVLRQIGIDLANSLSTPKKVSVGIIIIIKHTWDNLMR